MCNLLSYDKPFSAYTIHMLVWLLLFILLFLHYFATLSFNLWVLPF